MHCLQVTLADPGAAVAAVKECLLAGGVAAIPTETVYGLAVLWSNQAGRERIYALKRRPADKHLQMLAFSLEQACAAGVLPDPRLELIAAAFWPGPLTLVCRARDGGTAGLRLPDHAFVRQLLAALPEPLAATSANLSGEPPARVAAAAVAGLDGRPDLLVDGGEVDGRASSVISILGAAPELLRLGAVPLDAVRTCLARP